MLGRRPPIVGHGEESHGEKDEKHGGEEKICLRPLRLRLLSTAVAAPPTSVTPARAVPCARRPSSSGAGLVHAFAACGHHGRPASTVMANPLASSAVSRSMNGGKG